LYTEVYYGLSNPYGRQLYLAIDTDTLLLARIGSTNGDIKISLYEDYICIIIGSFFLPGKEFFVCKIFKKVDDKYTLIKEETCTFYTSDFFEYFNILLENGKINLSFDNKIQKYSLTIDFTEDNFYLNDKIMQIQQFSPNILNSKNLSKAFNRHSVIQEYNETILTKISCQVLGACNWIED
jgi:hypothetical protein